MVLEEVGRPLQPREIPVPEPGSGEVLVRVLACAVCRTDLHVVDGELPNPKLPLVPGHEIVGDVLRIGSGVARVQVGDRVGIPWLGWTCGTCAYCREGKENLCELAKFTGYTLDGGYAEFAVADQRYCFKLSPGLPPVETAPLLCAGLIGYRALKKVGHAKRLGLYGFGAAAHILAQIARWQGREIYAFTRPGDLAAQQFARSLGVHWAGDSTAAPPVELDAAIIFAPVGALVVQALNAVRKGGIVVCGGIYMSDIPAFPYRLLWHERRVESVANLTRADGEEFFALIAQVRVRVSAEMYALEQANEALAKLRAGELHGAAVLVIGQRGNTAANQGSRLEESSHVAPNFQKCQISF